MPADAAPPAAACCCCCCRLPVDCTVVCAACVCGSVMLRLVTGPTLAGACRLLPCRVVLCGSELHLLLLANLGRLPRIVALPQPGTKHCHAAPTVCGGARSGELQRGLRCCLFVFCQLRRCFCVRVCVCRCLAEVTLRFATRMRRVPCQAWVCCHPSPGGPPQVVQQLPHTCPTGSCTRVWRCAHSCAGPVLRCSVYSRRVAQPTGGSWPTGGS